MLVKELRAQKIDEKLSYNKNLFYGDKIIQT